MSSISITGLLIFLMLLVKRLSIRVAEELVIPDDTKLCRAVGDDQEADILREDLRRMFRWSQNWQMLFNLEKCSVMHMGKRNQELSYEMEGKVLKVSEEERDLGVIMQKSAKPSRQCAEASKKG